MATMTNLAYLDLAENDFSGRFLDFTNLPNVRYITAQYNDFSGPLPPTIGLLTNLGYAAFGGNHFSGPIPPEIGGLANVELLDLSGNEFDGAIPKEIAGLQKAYSIGLSTNHLSGTLPKELGQLTQLQFLDVSFNAFKGPFPQEIKNMTGLEDHRSSFAYNGLYANDASTRAFVNLKDQSERACRRDHRSLRDAELGHDPLRVLRRRLSGRRIDHSQRSDRGPGDDQREVARQHHHQKSAAGHDVLLHRRHRLASHLRPAESHHQRSHRARAGLDEAARDRARRSGHD
jgi:hypothetical protein